MSAAKRKPLSRKKLFEMLLTAKSLLTIHGMLLDSEEQCVRVRLLKWWEAKPNRKGAKS